MNREFEIEKGRTENLEEVAEFYEEVVDFLERGVNYPGWKKGVYPVREDAKIALLDQTLFVARDENGRIAGSVILNRKPEEAYRKMKWSVDADDSEVTVVHTLAVRPKYYRCGVARRLLEFVIESAKERKDKAVRLDVYEKNAPAIQLYKSLGFQYVDKADLGYGIWGLDFYELYELQLGE